MPSPTDETVTIPLGRPPATLPLDLSSLPPLWGGPRKSKTALYGLGWRTSLVEIFRKYDVSRLSSVRHKVFTRAAFEELDAFDGKIKFGIQFLCDFSVADDDDNNQICLITFNDREKNLTTLAGPDGDKFIEIMKKLMKLSEEDEASFMWYRCKGANDLDYEPI
ncbi:hypothetical protein C8R46DRAFT_1348696 [Mycena filopes]|nr:hypothetical protein C8R46DRAFT_1348696 [Mycena filopes]